MGFINHNNKLDLIISIGTGEEGLHIYESDVFILDIDELTDELQIQIWPNPAKDYLNLNNNTGTEGLLKVYSEDGKLIASYTIATHSQQLDISFLPPGAYILHYTSTGASLKFSSRLIKL